MLPNNNLGPANTSANGAIKQKYGDLCTRLYQEILSQGNVASLPGWQRQYNADYNVTTWTLTEDKNSGRVGSNGQLEVKIIGEGGYDFVRHEDLDQRGQLICTAAERIIKQQLPFNHPAREPLLQSIAENRKQFSAEIQRECKFDIKKIRNKDSEHFNTQFEKGKLAVRQLLADVAVTVKNAKDQNGNKISISDVFKEIAQEEKNHISEKGRPAVMKIGMVGEAGYQVPMVSMQFPQGKETIPSSDRSGKYNTKLSNHVMDGSGILTTDQAGNVKIKYDVMVDGHSSYTPLKESDELKRLHIGSEAVKEKIAATASDIQSTNPGMGTSANNPINVSLATMMLLTPYNAVEKIILGKESESRQTEESRMVLELMKNQKQPLKLKGKDGQPIFVRFDSTCMNLPVNGTMKVQRTVGSMLQDNINAKGFVEFSQNMESALTSSLDKITNPNNLTVQNRRQAVMLPAGLSFADLAFLNELHNQKRFPAETSNDLSASYQALSDNLKRYAETDNKNEKKALEKECKDLKRIIDNGEKLNSDKFKVVLEYRKNHFINENKSVLPNIYEKLDKLIAKTNISPEMRDHLMLEKRYLVAKELFFDKSYLDAKNAYKFQAMYLLANEQTGRQIETFCKSGEDRTGWMRVTLLALTTFKAMNGRDPNFSSKTDTANYHKNYVNASHELSASVENTAYNSAARGLQVSSSFTTKDKDMGFGKSMAVLAKKVFGGFKKQPSMIEEAAPETISAATMAKNSRLVTRRPESAVQNSRRDNVNTPDNSNWSWDAPSSRSSANDNRRQSISEDNYRSSINSSSVSEDRSSISYDSRYSSSNSLNTFGSRPQSTNYDNSGYSDFAKQFLTRIANSKNRSSIQQPDAPTPIHNSIAAPVRPSNDDRMSLSTTKREVIVDGDNNNNNSFRRRF